MHGSNPCGVACRSATFMTVPEKQGAVADSNCQRLQPAIRRHRSAPAPTQPGEANTLSKGSFMKIQQAITHTDAQGYPVLDLIIDGKPAYVVQPKRTLLNAGIVVLLDDDGYWRNAFVADCKPEEEDTVIPIRGG